MKRQLKAALVALLVSSACTSETVAPTKTILAAAPSLDVISVGSGPLYLPRAGFLIGVLADINNARVSVGTLRASSGMHQAVKYDATHHVFLLTTPAGSESHAQGINEFGYVVGRYVSSVNGIAVYWDPGGRAVPLAGGGGALTGAYDINENGLIVGFIQSATGTTDRAGYWNLAGAFTQLPLPVGAQGSQAYAVNDNGDIVGQTNFANPQDVRPTLWQAPSYIPRLLPLPQGFAEGSVQGISNSGAMVGSLTSCNPQCGSSPFTAAVWTNAGSIPTAINGSNWIARDVSESGIVVGDGSAAFVWTEHAGVLLLATTGAATGINDAGDVVGSHWSGTSNEPTQWSVAIQSDEGDQDGDGIPDGVDSCPNDRDNDIDADGYCGDVDNAPNDYNPCQEDSDSDHIADPLDDCPLDAENDVDNDGLCANVDNAPYVANPEQEDTDRDHIGDVADACPLDSRNDEDRDGVCGDVDNAPLVSNPGQEDVDRDGIGDVADNCPAVVNPDQRDADQDGVGDACESNTPPTITQLTGPAGPIQLVSGSATATMVLAFTDPDERDTHLTTFVCEDGTVDGNVCRFTETGVYKVTATVTDSYGNADAETFEYVVVYDPTAGFVTGGGWINYKGEACPVLCGSAAGRADFGFVSKYQKGATVPSGDTRFEFNAGSLQFVSTSYEWLVVSGSKGQFKGRGKINGGGDYGFLLTAIDGSLDKFRIKIWDRIAGEENPVFDTGAEIQLDKVNGGGSIVIHSK